MKSFFCVFHLWYFQFRFQKYLGVINRDNCHLDDLKLGCRELLKNDRLNKSSYATFFLFFLYTFVYPYLFIYLRQKLCTENNSARLYALTNNDIVFCLCTLPNPHTEQYSTKQQTIYFFILIHVPCPHCKIFCVCGFFFCETTITAIIFLFQNCWAYIFFFFICVGKI